MKPHAPTRNATVLFTVLAIIVLSAATSPAAVLTVTNDLVTHYDAALGTYTNDGTIQAVNGQLVQWWDDQATAIAGNNAAQQTYTKPTLQTNGLNGLPVLHFNGGQNLLVLDVGAGGSSSPMGTALDTDTLSWFAVVNKSGTATPQSVLRAETNLGGNRWGSFYQTGQYYSHSRTSGGSMIASNNVTPTDSFVVMSAVWDGSHPSDTVEQWLNGVSGGVGTGATQTGTFNRFRIGNSSDAASGLTGDIAEVLIYNAALSVSDRQAVEDYLNAKYFAAPTDAPVTNGLLVHLDGSSASTNLAGKVGAWHNRVGLQHSALQASEARKPDLISGELNGHDVLRFDGDNPSAGDRDYMDITGSSDFDSDELTWFIVAAPDYTGGADLLLRSAYTSGASGGSGSLWGTYTENGNLISHARNSSSGIEGASTSTTPGEFVLVTGLWDAADTVHQFVNGASVGSNAGATATPTGHIRTRIGATSNTVDAHFSGDMAEVLIYNQALSNPERRDVEDYLYDKYFRSGPPRVNDYPLANGLRLHATADIRDVDYPTVLDTAGTPQNGTINGTSMQLTAGILGEAAQFPGSDSDYVSFGDVLDPGTDSYTVSLWFNDTSMSGNQFLVSKGNPGSVNPGWSIWLGGSTLYLRGNHDGGALGTRFQITETGISLDEWHHVVMVLDRSDDTMYGYLDGALFDSDNMTAGLGISNGDPLYAGRRLSTGAAYSGLLDDFAIWDRAISADEVGWLYAKGLNGHNAATIPEPSTCCLLGVGLIGLLAAGRRRRGTLVATA